MASLASIPLTVNQEILGVVSRPGNLSGTYGREQNEQAVDSEMKDNMALNPTSSSTAGYVFWLPHLCDKSDRKN
jgi:hypothetical protein